MAPSKRGSASNPTASQRHSRAVENQVTENVVHLDDPSTPRNQVQAPQSGSTALPAIAGTANPNQDVLGYGHYSPHQIQSLFRNLPHAFPTAQASSSNIAPPSRHNEHTTASRYQSQAPVLQHARRSTLTATFQSSTSANTCSDLQSTNDANLPDAQQLHDPFEYQAPLDTAPIQVRHNEMFGLTAGSPVIDATFTGATDSPAPEHLNAFTQHQSHSPMFAVLQWPDDVEPADYQSPAANQAPAGDEDEHNFYSQAQIENSMTPPGQLYLSPPVIDAIDTDITMGEGSPPPPKRRRKARGEKSPPKKVERTQQHRDNEKEARLRVANFAADLRTVLVESPRTSEEDKKLKWVYQELFQGAAQHIRGDLAIIKEQKDTITQLERRLNELEQVRQRENQGWNDLYTQLWGRYQELQARLDAPQPERKYDRPDDYNTLFGERTAQPSEKVDSERREDESLPWASTA